MVSLNDINVRADLVNMGKHERTLDAIRSNPIRSNIDWRDIENLFTHLGGSVSEGNGSRVRVSLNEILAVFHRPHPGNEASKPMIKSVRKFLSNAGVPE